tara:strand:+ start:74 stop:352 length:279 start_codon:yes stop_codon:yes gene_type:complete
MSRLSGYPYVESTWDASSISDGDEQATDVTVPGASLGDFVLSSFSLDLADVVLTAAVTAANRVTAVLANNTGGSVDLASGTLRVRVVPFADA